MSDEQKKAPIDEDDRKYLTPRPERRLDKAGFMFVPQTWEQLYSYAKEISATEFVPNQMRGKPGAVLAAWQKGQEVGLQPMAALQSIAVINGRPSIHSSGYWALITSNPLCEDWTELPPHEAARVGYGECTIKRRGKKSPETRRFTMEDAKRADLLDKDNWKKYPGQMLVWRARHLAGEAAIPEASQGLVPSDIAQDLEPLDVTPKPEAPLQMPEAIKPTDPIAQPEKGPDETEKPPDSSQQVAPVEAQAQAPTTGNGAQDQPPAEKPSIKAVLDWIQGADAAVFKDTSALSAKLKGLSNKDQIAACRAWNERSRQAK